MRISGVTYATRRTHRARRTVLTIFVILLVLILAVGIISAYEGWNLMNPGRKGLDKISSNVVPVYRDVSFKSSNKSIVLNGWFFQTGNSDKTVVLAHSYAKNRLEFGLQTVDIIKQFLGKGYNVLTFDFRNSGKSGGKLTSFGCYEKDDLLGAISYVRQQGSNHMVLMGFSTGAAASILAASESANVDAVIADSSYSNLTAYMQNNLNNLTGLPAFPFNKTTLLAIQLIGGIDTANADPISAISNMKKSTAILLIHGRDDSIIPVKNSEDIYNTYKTVNPDKTEFWETDDTGNATSYLKYPAQYMAKVFEFLDKAYTSR